ncbi:uncharacterized protein L203_104929 [Cryptococcus depauperatus CBS 7841]|uniref:Uncharacterized protein n=1 Tax=Cryptococcus depauperatus CBS 7841 TaxID=1295531 RepID=A0A1E3IMW9_9TREE|nr:hypothetical protein L203_01859 [Cryptococcus depauperatus CBS 7841]
MSFRVAARLSTRLAGQRVAATPVFTRRTASSSAGHKAGSDTPWLLGSIVGFGGLTALVLYPSKKTIAEHAVPHSQEKVEISESAPKVEVGKDAVQNSSADRPTASENPKDIHPNVDRAPDNIPSKKVGKGQKAGEDLKPEAKDGGANASEIAQMQKSGEESKEGESSDSGVQEDKIKESLIQSEMADVPEVAKAAESNNQSPAQKS